MKNSSHKIGRLWALASLLLIISSKSFSSAECSKTFDTSFNEFDPRDLGSFLLKPDLIEFGQADFPSQEGFSVAHRNDALYMTWAAENAAFALHNSARLKVAAIFDQVAKNRNDLKIKIVGSSTPVTELFRLRRTAKNSIERNEDPSRGTSWWSYHSYSSLIPRKEPEGFSRLIMTSYPILTDEKYEGHDQTVYSTYRLKNEKEVVLSIFMRSNLNKKFYVQHPTERIRSLISRDSETVLQELVDKSMTTRLMSQGDLIRFFHATRGWFGAIKYYRGSASIGRSVIAGLFARIFHQKLVVPDDPYNLDILALILSEEDFNSRLIKLNPME